MANTIKATNNFIELSLDGLTDFDVTTDLENLGLNFNASNGIRVRKVIFIPSAAGDKVVIRDTQNGPIMFYATDVLGTYDILKDDYREDGKIDRGKLVTPFIDASECTITNANQAFVIFEL